MSDLQIKPVWKRNVLDVWRKAFVLCWGNQNSNCSKLCVFITKRGLFASAAQDADVKVVTTKIGTELDKNIKEFRSSNIMDQFQRQIALVFSPLQDYAFGSGTIDFPMWFADEFPGMSIVKANR